MSEREPSRLEATCDDLQSDHQQAGGLVRGRGSVPRLNLAVVTETYFPEINGVAHTLRNVVEGLRGRGHEVQVLRPRQGRDDAGCEDPDMLCLPGLPIPGYSGLRFGLPAKRALRRIWNAQRPDALYISTEGPLGMSALNVARRLGIPVIGGFHTNFHQYSRHYRIGFLAPLVEAHLRRFHNRCRATLVPTAPLCEHLLERRFERIEVMGRGVDTDRFDPNRRCASLRASWGADASTPVAMLVGRLAPEKNLGVAVRAFEALRERLPDARFVLVGDGPSRAAIERAHPEFVFAGMRTGEDLATHYASADLFLFPSASETYGNVFLEAMASGLPVWAYDYAAARETLRHDESAFLATLDDAEEASGERFLALAGAVTEARGRWTEMGTAARRAGLDHSWSRIVLRMESLFFDAVDSPTAAEVRDAIS